jgi:hypothetical protein
LKLGDDGNYFLMSLYIFSCFERRQLLQRFKLSISQYHEIQFHFNFLNQIGLIEWHEFPYKLQISFRYVPGKTVPPYANTQRNKYGVITKIIIIKYL